ncbi:hypothetical protein N7539_002028 [Penicillium diatomitis]|uniref:Uncharacterized protein n=1 Tax=Penicillium diatomitis TaxID=2819901 RepID=A0A9X0C075_9EURO|nr:uncharacterized protein N7539_002028 [Penicillium diatomitis]KAJ5493282.1 hypothetical protein N7539_002028 [Penicillium diatomitis]
MCDAPFFFPICIQCGTDQNPCRCKVVGPTLGHLLAGIDLLWLRMYTNGQRVSRAEDVLGYPVKLNGQVSNAIPF